MKLWRGGGQEVAHSNELDQPHGSSTVTFGAFFVVVMTFQKKKIIEMLSSTVPAEEIWLNVSKLSAGR